MKIKEKMKSISEKIYCKKRLACLEKKVFEALTQLMDECIQKNENIKVNFLASMFYEKIGTMPLDCAIRLFEILEQKYNGDFESELFVCTPNNEFKLKKPYSISLSSLKHEGEESLLHFDIAKMATQDLLQKEFGKAQKIYGNNFNGMIFVLTKSNDLNRYKIIL